MNEIIKTAMQTAGIGTVELAKRAGISPTVLYKKMREGMPEEEQQNYAKLCKGEKVLEYVGCRKCKKYYNKRSCLYIFCPICGGRMEAITKSEAEEQKRNAKVDATIANIKNYVDKLCEIMDYGTVDISDIKIGGLTLEEWGRIDG